MLIILRVIHVLFGVFWAGTAMFTAAFLVPAVRASGPAGGPIMQQIGQKRKLPVYFLVAGILTVLSGLGLYWRASDGFRNTWMHSGPGITFGIGALFALTAMCVGIFGATPTAKRAGALGAAIAAGAKPPTPEQAAEMQRLQAKLGKMSALGAVLLTVTVLAMAIARYIP